MLNQKRKNATAVPYCMLVPWSVAFFCCLFIPFFKKMDLHHQFFCFYWSTQCGYRLSSTTPTQHTTPLFDKFILVIAEILHHNARQTCTMRIILPQQKVTGKLWAHTLERWSTWSSPIIQNNSQNLPTDVFTRSILILIGLWIQIFEPMLHSWCRIRCLL